MRGIVGVRFGMATAALILVATLGAAATAPQESPYERLKKLDQWKAQAIQDVETRLRDRLALNRRNEEGERDRNAAAYKGGILPSKTYQANEEAITLKYKKRDDEAQAAYKKGLQTVEDEYWRRFRETSGSAAWSTGTMREWKGSDSYSGKLSNFQATDNGWTATWTAYRERDKKLDGKWAVTATYSDGRIRIDEGHSGQVWIGKCSGGAEAGAMSCTGTEKSDTKFNFSVTLSK